MEDNEATIPEPNDGGIYTVMGNIKKEIVEGMLELRNDEAEAEILKRCKLASIKGEQKENILKFYRAEKRAHNNRVKTEDNQKEESDLLKVFRSIITATDQKGMFEQLKAHLKNDWLDVREDTVLAFIKEICDVLEVDTENKNILKKFYREEKTIFDEAKKQARAEAGIQEPIDLDSVSGRNDAYHRIANAYLENKELVYVAGSLRSYADGIYPMNKESTDFVKKEILALALDRFHTPLSENNVTAIVKIIEMLKTVRLEDCEPDNDKVILTNNKILNLETFEASDFTRTKVYFSKIPTDYIPDAPEPELFTKYLDTTFKGDDVSRKKIQELVGYLLTRNYKYQYIFYLLGDGGEGKGVLLKLILFLLGAENIAGYSLHQLTDHPNVMYHIAELHGKFANICGDTGQKQVENTEHIKKLSSGTDIVAGRRVRERPFDFISFAKIILLLNRVPKKDAYSTGDKRRDLIISFNNKIIDTDIEIKDLADVIKNAGEMPGVLNWAIEGLKRLEAQGGFTGMKTITERGLEYEMKSQPMKHFVDDCLVDDRDGFLRNAVIYEKYTEYRKKHGMPELGQEEIKNGIKYYCNQLGWNVAERRQVKNGIKARGMANIALIDEFDGRTLENYAESTKNLILFAKDEYNLFVVDVGKFIDDYLSKNLDIILPDREMHINLATILKSRGWKH